MKKVKKMVSICLCIIMILTMSVQAYASENFYAEEGEKSEEILCYSVNETAEGDESLSIVEDEDVLSRIKEHQFDHEIVSASKQSVYFVNEAEDAESLKARGNTFVDDDTTTHENVMTLYLVVYKDTSGNYYAYGTADWATGITLAGPNGQAIGYDHITWGGTQAFKASAYSASGCYDDDDDTSISITKEKSDSYQGYSWRFNEYKASTGLFDDSLRAEYIDCYVKLTRVKSNLQGEETSIKLTYIHTYTDLDITIGFTPTSDGGAYTVTYTESDETWDAAVDVPGIEY